MVQELKRLSVLRTGILMGIMYAFVGGVMALFMLGVGLLGGGGPRAMTHMLPMLAAYPVMGFIGGILTAAAYNFVAKWVGGLRLTLEPVVESVSATSGTAAPRGTTCGHCQSAIPAGLTACPDCGWSEDLAQPS